LNGFADRFYIGLFSVALAFILGALVWLSFHIFFAGATHFVPFIYVFYFSLAVGFLGTLQKTNLVIYIIETLMKIVAGFGRLS